MSDLSTQFTEASTLYGKEKMHALEQCAHLAVSEFKSGKVDKESLELYLDVIRTYMSTYRVTDQSMSMTFIKMIKKLHELEGVGEAKILATKQAEVATESGTFQIADDSFVPDDEYNPHKIVEQMNSGKLFMWGMGGDGTLDFIVRCIKASTPVPTDKEYRIIRGSTPIGLLKVTSGEVVVTDMGFDPEQSKARLKVSPGWYQVAVFARAIPDKFYGFLVVLCQTDSDKSPAFAEIPSLDM